MPFAEMRPTTGYCEYFENGIKISFYHSKLFVFLQLQILKI